MTSAIGDLWLRIAHAPPEASDLRQRRAVYVRYSLLGSIAVIVALVLQNLELFEPQGANRYVLWAIILGSNLFAMYLWARTRYYQKYRWIDIVIAIPIIFAMQGVAETDASQAQLLGFPRISTLSGDSLLAVVFVSTYFSGNFKGYAIWCLADVLSFFYFSHQIRPESAQFTQASSFYFPVVVLSLYLNWAISEEGYANIALRRRLEEEKSNSDTLLYNVLPEEVANRLRRGEAVADAFSDATVVFVDLVGSSTLARTLSPRHFLSVLNDFFSLADQCAERHRLEKVKTIGDAYLAIAGGRSGGDTISALRFAIDLGTAVRDLARTRQLGIDIRIGIHTGPVVGGVIGQTRATYDYWGDTMNIAARVESAADTGGISVTKQTYFATRDEVTYLPPRTVLLKGVGEMQVYDVSTDPSPRRH